MSSPLLCSVAFVTFGKKLGETAYTAYPFEDANVLGNLIVTCPFVVVSPLGKLPENGVTLEQSAFAQFNASTFAFCALSKFNVKSTTAFAGAAKSKNKAANNIV